MPPPKKPARKPSGSSDGSNGVPLEDDVLTLEEAAAFLKTTEEDVLQAVRERGLSGQAVGSVWRFSRSAVHRWLSSSQDQQSNKGLWLAVAGKYEGDEDLLRIREEAYRQRRRSAAEDV